MKAFLACATMVAVSALAVGGAIAAEGGCGMNSNKPCAEQGKHSAKEPAYSMNSNKPKPQQASEAPERAQVQAKEGGETAAKATLTGVSASDLKVKPKPPKTSEKETVPR